jgi:hypothetical protein
MQQVKPFYKSKGVMGSLLALAGLAAQALGYQFGPEEQKTAIILVSALFQAAGGLLALWGRITAKEQVKLKVPAPPAAALVALLCVGLALAGGCASKEEVLAYYEAQVLAQQVKAAVEAQKKPLLRIEAKEGQDISFTGLKAIEVYAPTCAAEGKGYQVAQHKDPAYSVGTTVLSIAAGVAGIWLSGQNMVDLANAVGQHAGGNTHVGGNLNSGENSGANKGNNTAGRDINSGAQSGNDRDNPDSHDQYAATPAPAE